MFLKFGEKLKELRIKNNLTQDDVAKMIGISRRAYIAYEQENVRPRKRDTYTKLSDAFNCDVNYLLMEDKAAIAGATAAVSALGIALGTATFAPVGVIAALGSFLALKKGTAKDSEKKILSYNNDMLLQYEKRQRLFAATASGIIYNALINKGITWTIENTEDIDTLGVKPDLAINISNQFIEKWWFTFWAKDSELDSHVTVSTRDRADVMFSRYVSAKQNPNRQVSIVVDDMELFNAICEFKGHNSYRGNLSVLLINMENVRIEKEECICHYDDEVNEEMLKICNEK